MKKRLVNEIPNILKKYKNVKVFDRDNIIFEIKVDDLTISLEFNDNYPFKCPLVKVNNYNYMSILKIRYYDILKQLVSTNCLCCESILCGNKWCAIMNVNDIIEEVIQNINIKKKVMQLYLISKIKNNYLCDDIPINEFI